MLQDLARFAEQLDRARRLIGILLLSDCWRRHETGEECGNTMMLHELATNAVKYGALSTQGGKITIDWREEAAGKAKRVSLTWIESGGPTVSPPQRLGQGTRFIQQGVRYELGGNAILEYPPEGLRAAIDFLIEDADPAPGPPFRLAEGA